MAGAGRGGDSACGSLRESAGTCGSLRELACARHGRFSLFRRAITAADLLLALRQALGKGACPSWPFLGGTRPARKASLPPAYAQSFHGRQVRIPDTVGRDLREAQHIGTGKRIAACPLIRVAAAIRTCFPDLLQRDGKLDCSGCWLSMPPGFEPHRRLHFLSNRKRHGE